MKKVTAILIILVTMVFSVGALADTFFWYESFLWYSTDSAGHTEVHQSKPLAWKTYMVNHNFPESVIRDVSALCKQYYGSPVGWLGLLCTAGCNVRTQPNLGDSYKGFQLHGNTTVYVNFSFIDMSNNEWYYVTCLDGSCGFVRANRIQLIPV